MCLCVSVGFVVYCVCLCSVHTYVCVHVCVHVCIIDFCTKER